MGDAIIPEATEDASGEAQQTPPPTMEDTPAWARELLDFLQTEKQERQTRRQARQARAKRVEDQGEQAEDQGEQQDAPPLTVQKPETPTPEQPASKPRRQQRRRVIKFW